MQRSGAWLVRAGEPFRFPGENIFLGKKIRPSALPAPLTPFGCFGKIGRRQENFSAVADDHFRVEARANFAVGVEGTRIEIDLRERLPRPVLLLELNRVFQNQRVSQFGVAVLSGYVHVEDDAKVGTLGFVLHQALEKEATVVERKAGEDDLCLRPRPTSRPPYRCARLHPPLDRPPPG